jgi:hypothetical protein
MSFEADARFRPNLEVSHTYRSNEHLPSSICDHVNAAFEARFADPRQEQAVEDE